MKTEDSGAGFVPGFLLGGLLGAALALLITPRSGEETRDTVMERGILLKDRAGEVAGKAMGEADGLLARGKTVIEDQKVRLQDALEEGKEAASQKKTELLSKYRVAKETGEVPFPADELPGDEM